MQVPCTFVKRKGKGVFASNCTIQEQYVCLIKAINDNQQIYGRFAAKSTNTEVFSYAKELLGDDFDIGVYPNFKFEDTGIYGSDLDPDVDDSFMLF